MIDGQMGIFLLDYAWTNSKFWLLFSWENEILIKFVNVDCWIVIVEFKWFCHHGQIKQMAVWLS